MGDEEDSAPRGTLMEDEPLTVTIKETQDGGWCLWFEPGMIHLRFREPTTYERALEAAKWLRKIFDISTPVPYQPPPLPIPPDDFGRGQPN